MPLAVKRKFRKVPGCQLVREAAFIPSTLNEEHRTVQVCFSSGAKGRRWSWTEGLHNEELEIAPKAIRLKRLNAGGPVLDTHQSRNMAAQIGVVVRAWIEGGKAYAELKFSEKAAAQEIFNDVKQGIVRNVSVGYDVHKYQDVTENDDKIKTFRAVDWEPYEISFVPMPFDVDAQVRSASPVPFETKIVTRSGDAGSATNEDPMPPEVKPAPATTRAPEATPAPVAAPAAAPAPVVDPEAIRAEERARASEITTLCERAQVPEMAKEFIEKGVTLDTVRQAILDKQFAEQEKNPTRSGHGNVTGGEMEHQKIARAVEFGLLHRVGVKVAEKDFDEGARHFRNLSLRELARELCERNGISTRGLSISQIAAKVFQIRTGGMQSTSDLANIVANVQNKTLRFGYTEAPQTFLPLVRKVEVPDFKQVQRTQLGEAPSLALINEHGEYTTGAVSDSKEVYSLKKYGRKVAFTREMIINDDLDALSRIPMAMGRQAANLESDLVWAIFTANAAMGDGNNLFSAAHANNASTAVISDTTLSAGRKLMRKQTGLDGATILNIEPKYLIGPAAIESTIRKYVSTELMPVTADTINTFKGLLTPIIEPRLDASSETAWYLGADVGQIDIIELAYLQGQQGPYTETREGFDVDGVEIKIRHEVVAKAIDWRGLFRNKTL